MLVNTACKISTPVIPPSTPTTEQFSTITKSDWQAILEEWRASECVPCGLLKDSCFARTHYGWYIGKKRGIELNKVWISPNKVGQEQAATIVYDDDSYWNNYVALCYTIDDKTYVLDGAFFEQPVLQETWEKRLIFEPTHFDITITKGNKSSAYASEHDLNFTQKELQRFWVEWIEHHGGNTEENLKQYKKCFEVVAVWSASRNHRFDVICRNGVGPFR